MSTQQKWFCFFVSSLVLCIPAFYNGFPFLFPDTVGYIDSGFENRVGNARTWLYAGFLRHSSLWESLWIVIFAQGMLVSGTVYLMFKYFFEEKKLELSFISYLLIVGTTTAVSFHVSMIMPDIFTPIVILCFCLLIFSENMSRRDYWLVIFLFLFSSGTHNSHLVLNLGLVGGLAVGKLIKKWQPFYIKAGITSRKIGFITGLIVVTHFSVCAIHYSKGGDFAATRGGSIFLFARLCDFGIAQSYLNENCEEWGHDICNYVERMTLGRHYLWAGTSYFNKTGNWTAENEAFYKELVWNILTTPKYLKKYMISCIEATFMQFFSFESSPLSEMENSKENGPIGQVKNYFPNYYIAAYHSRQIQGNYDTIQINLNNMVQQIVLYLAGFVLVLLFFDENYDKKQKMLALFILLGMLINAFIAGATSGVYSRYQSRVAWLITLPAFWYLFAIYRTKISDKLFKK
ncbi:hypothetical protein [Aureispira anguillae]|uniref:Uncharacterized protein n=1 Tax=Aureispira anguillae TaxID=2864201 RepID=A0A916DSX4_9BACT|nr:hypothetical protein [Aureispira anguillae]BDS11096.1 hypothetical protein AsAng_0018070 [Aureispira anguillae]